MPSPDWCLLRRFETALYCLAYRKAPNLGVAAEAVGCDPGTISTHLEKASVPLKKFKRGGAIEPMLPEVLRAVELMETAAGIAPKRSSVAVLADPVPTNAAPESVSISLPLEGEANALEKLKGLHPNLEVTVMARLKVEG